MSTYEYRGKWRYEFIRKGKRFQGWWYATKLEAQHAEYEARNALQVTNTGFIKLCEARLESLVTERSKSHFTKNHRLLKNLMAIWGTKKNITRDDVEKYLRWAVTPKKKKILHREIMSGSKSLANRHLRLIRALFQHGIQAGICEIDPTKGIRPFSIEQVKRYVPPIEHIRKVLGCADPEQHSYLTVLIHTMARVDAVNQLRWEDVYDDYLILKTRKARNSNLKLIHVPINQTLKDTLAKLPRKSEYVFTNPKTGKPYVYRNALMKRLCKRAGVKRFSYHALRHFGASRMVQQGVPLTDIQQILGHEKVTTTAIYLRAMGDGVKEAVKKLEDI